MSEKERESKVSREPHLIDLIATYFPPKYAKKYLNINNLKKSVDALLIKPPRGSNAYAERCEVQRVASELDEKHPKMSAAKIAKHPDILSSGGKYYTFKTRYAWVREVVKRNPGRPSNNNS